MSEVEDPRAEAPGCRSVAKMAEGVDAALDAEFGTDEPQPLSAEFRRRLIDAAERPLTVRREAFRLAGFATGHRRKSHGDVCSECSAQWPCPEVRRAAQPLLDAYELSASVGWTEWS